MCSTEYMKSAHAYCLKTNLHMCSVSFILEYSFLFTIYSCVAILINPYMNNFINNIIIATYVASNIFTDIEETSICMHGCIHA